MNKYLGVWFVSRKSIDEALAWHDKRTFEHTFRYDSRQVIEFQRPRGSTRIDLISWINEIVKRPHNVQALQFELMQCAWIIEFDASIFRSTIHFVTSNETSIVIFQLKLIEHVFF